MPSLKDSTFGGTVVYLCEHSANGALGVIVNRPTNLTLNDLLSRLELSPEIDVPITHSIMFGGPVQDNRGFVLHSPPGSFSSMLRVTDEIGFTTSKDVIESIASGRGPSKFLVSIGYSGWSAGQLEDEIKQNGWLTVPANEKIIFDCPIDERYRAAYALLGINPTNLYSAAGNA